MLLFVSGVVTGIILIIVGVVAVSLYLENAAWTRAELAARHNHLMQSGSER